MKKIFKLLIAGVIIAGIAIGVYFIFFNNKHNNDQIYAKVYGLNNSLIYTKNNKNVNMFSTVNQVVVEMNGDLATLFNGQVPDVKAYFDAFIETKNLYALHQEQILNFGIFINEEKNNQIVDQMNKAYENLNKIYTNAYEYLQKTYLTEGASQNKNVEYIENFYTVFQNALSEMNIFYYNASIAFAHGTQNLMENTNLQKLKVEYSAVVANRYAKNFIKNKENNTDIANKSKQIILSVNSTTLDTYLNNKQAVDEIWASSKNMNLDSLAEKDLNGSLESYIASIENMAEKTKLENYYNLVIKG